MKQNKPAYTVQKFNTIREMTELARNESPDKIAYRYKDDSEQVISVTFRAFYDVIENLGAALTDMGYGQAHVACISENSYSWITAYLTILKGAGVFVPIDKELAAADKLHLLNDSESTVVFFSEKQESFLRENKDKLPNIRCFIGFDLVQDDGDFLSYAQLIEKGKAMDKSAYDGLRSDEHALKMLVYTSGTTGMAKGVMLTEHNLVSSVYYGLQVSQVYDVGLSVLPYNHVYESVCDILVAHHLRSTLCINRSMKDIVKDLKLYQPSYIYLVPALAEVLYASITRNIKKQKKEKTFARGVKISRFLLKLGIDLRPKLFKELRDVFGGRIVKIVCGGAPIRPELGKFFDDIGIILTGGYGITECSPLVSVNDEHCNDFHTAGSRLPCLEWRIDNPNTEGIGEICVKGDVVMKGYFKKPEKTAEVLKDGWFYTGDYGYITEDDQIVLTGRKKNIIVLNSGKNIYPEEIELIIKNIHYISEVVVRGLKNENGDEFSLLAEVYLEEEKSNEDVFQDIQNILKDQPSYKNVTKVIIRTEPFVKTTTNKIKR